MLTARVSGLEPVFVSRWHGLAAAGDWRCKAWSRSLVLGARISGDGARLADAMPALEGPVPRLPKTSKLLGQWLCRRNPFSGRRGRLVF
jgi:hypothetical protein